MCCAMEVAGEHNDSMETARTSQHRPRLLYSCAVSALTVARRAYRRAEDLGGPMGTMVKTLASWASPILHPLQHRCLSLLSFFDGHILAAEDAVVSVFPPAAHLFGLLYRLVLLFEALPKKFDDAADQLPAMIQRAPVLGWGLAKLGESWSLLAPFAWEHGRAGEEREIGVDTSWEEHPPAPAGSVPEEDASDALQEEEEEEEGRKAVPILDLLNSFDEDKDLKLFEYDEQRVRYLHRRVKEARAMVVETLQGMDCALEDEIHVEEEEDLVAAKRPVDEEGEGTPQSESEVLEKDPILELFDEGWCMR